MLLKQQPEKIGNENAEYIEVFLSNGDRLWIYDDNDGYGWVKLIRHDDVEKSLVTSYTKRDRVVSREKRFNNTMVKGRTIELRSERNDVEDNDKRTLVEVTQFYPRKRR